MRPGFAAANLLIQKQAHTVGESDARRCGHPDFRIG